MREENEILEKIENELDSISSEQDESIDKVVDPEKEKKRKEQAEALQIAVESGKTDSLIRKVAYILNRYPDTRNSDIALQLQFWREFQSFTGDVVNVDKLFTYERLTSITRSRQKIQNEYMLYQADNRIKKWRTDNEEVERERQIANKPSMPIVNIYADETGKNDKYTMVGSIWMLDQRIQGEIISQLSDWKHANSEKEKFPKEFHFRKMDNRGNDIEHYKAFFDILMANSDMVSFKAIAVNRHNLNRTNVSEVLKSLYKQLIRLGVEHERNEKRIIPPKQISYTKDREGGESAFELKQIQQEIIDNLKLHYNDEIRLNNFSSLPAYQIMPLQLADLFVASLNRIFNYQPENTARNAKDELAEYILESINLNKIQYSVDQINQDVEVYSETDMSTLFIFE